MIYLELFITFFQIGLFGFGGGYGMLSLIQTETVVQHQWLTTAEFTNIVAISQMPPGPVGINTATYCGYAAAEKAGFGDAMAVLGSFTATFALVLPSVILMILISKMFMKYMDTPVMQSIFTALRPVVVGLLAAATVLLMNSDNFKTMTGDRIDARINQRLIENIFFKNSPLHDGAMIISKKRIKAAGCILPVSHDLHIPKELGLRHRAAMGISQESDALAIVVSEETGRISVAIHGHFRLRLSAEELEAILAKEVR